MDYDRYTARAVTLAVGLLNTVEDAGEDPEAVRSFVLSSELHEGEPLSDADLAGLGLLARRLHPVFAGTVEQAADTLNDILDEAQLDPHLVQHDGQGWHVHHVEEGAPVARWFAAAAAMTLATLVARDGVERLGTCAALGCDRVFVDDSRNRSKRFCSEACAARTKQAAYRARQREAG